MLYQVIYSSQATKPLTTADLEKILVDARAGNEAHNVTGALVYVDGVFLQILEGDKDTVFKLMSSIGKDTRHSSVKVFHEAQINERAFGSWRMAYLSPRPEELSIWAGLPGTATIESILEDMDRDADRVAQVAGNVLKALAS